MRSACQSADAASLLRVPHPFAPSTKGAWRYPISSGSSAYRQGRAIRSSPETPQPRHLSPTVRFHLLGAQIPIPPWHINLSINAKKGLAAAAARRPVSLSFTQKPPHKFPAPRNSRIPQPLRKLSSRGPTRSHLFPSNSCQRFRLAHTVPIEMHEPGNGKPKRHESVYARIHDLHSGR
jgi:hypothetical protein